ncbi:MAG TPA: anti-sigma factor [Burkholderiales bacterium]|nr:anti-sigma factor [Burkholderiales bacterium]
MKPVAEAELHTYVDGGLSEEAKAEIEAWLRAHPEDAEKVRAYAEQNALLRTLYNPVLEEPVPAAMLAVRPPVWRRYAAAAAIFAIGLGLGWLARGEFVAPQVVQLSLARQAATAHVVYAPEVRHPVEVPATEEAHLVGWLSKRVGTTLKAPKLAPLGYDLVGGRLLSGPQGPVAHFMYQDGRGQRLTLYVSRQRGEPRDTAFRFSQEDRVSVFYWVDGNFGYALSGEMRRDQLLQVAEVVYKQLNP